MSYTLEDKIVQIRTAPTQGEAFSRYNTIMEGYGYNRNVYSLVNDHPSMGLESKHGFVGTYPQDWIDYYYEQSYFSVDPIWQGVINSATPFYWADEIEKFKHNPRYSEEDQKNSRSMLNFAQDAGVSSGIGMSFVSPLGEIAAVGLARDTPETVRDYSAMAEIYLLSSFFHDKFRSFFERPRAPVLTPREHEILLWASEGKVDHDIGDILGISAPTVRFHWKNIFEKLDANNRSLAIIKAIRLQIITPHLLRAPYQG